MGLSRRRAWVLATTLALIGAWCGPARAQERPTPSIPPPSAPRPRRARRSESDGPAAGLPHSRGR